MKNEQSRSHLEYTAQVISMFSLSMKFPRLVQTAHRFYLLGAELPFVDFYGVDGALVHDFLARHAINTSVKHSLLPVGDQALKKA